MTLYVKGFKIDRQKVADMIGAPRGDPVVYAGIRVVVEQLNRSAYIDIVAGYEPPSPDGQRHLALVVYQSCPSPYSCGTRRLGAL